MSQPLPQLYEWVRQTREVLFTYCESLPAELYVTTHPGFGHGSIRATHLHVADCYDHWLANFGLREGRSRYKPEDYPDLAAVRRAFAAADATVQRFLARYGASLDESVTNSVRWQPEPLTVPALWLLSHSITHEFHHKGQIASLGRILGHPAPDTDLLLP